MKEREFRESQIVKRFLDELKEHFKEIDIDFKPKHIAVIYKDPKEEDFSWFAWHKWGEKIEHSVCSGGNLFEVFMDIPLHILLSLEERGKYLTRRDEKRVKKAIELLRNLKFKDVEENNG